MKKVTFTAIAFLSLFVLLAQTVVAATNIDPVDKFAKTLIDGRYIDFGCPFVSSTIVGAEQLPFTVSSSPSVSASPVDPALYSSMTARDFTMTSTAASTISQYTIDPTTPATAPYSCDVVVSDYAITGTAHDQDGGDISLNPLLSGVFNDGLGNLSGYAWGAMTGWINFAPINGGVTIDIDGYFHGLAWSENIGWIAFNCDELGTCGTDRFRVRTSWRPGGANVPTPIDPAVVIPTAEVVAATPTGTTTVETPVPVPTPTPSPSSSSNPTPNSTTTPSPTPTPGSNNPPSSTTPPGQTSPTPGTPSTTPTPDTSPSPSGSPAASNPVIEQISATVEEVVQTVSQGVESASVALDTSIGDTAFKVIVLAGVVAALVSSSSSAWRSAFSVLAFRKRKPWGTVYDSITKQPLDPAYVVLKDAAGNEINTSITDLDGRYGFLAAQGTYSIIANKTNYTFPSARLAGRTSDELYTDLYFGGSIMIANAGDVITKNIPMDATNFDWNEYAKKEQSLLKFYSKRTLWFARITNILFWFGFALSTFALFIAPEPLNIGIFALYIAVFTLKETLLKPKKQGAISDRAGNPMAFAILRIFSAQLNTEIAHKAANALGQYFALVPNGNYYVKIERKNTDGSYTQVYTSETFEVKKGVINKNFEI